MSGLALARAAEALIGAPFRLHGRDPQNGLDCIGLLGAALEQIGRPLTLPSGYPLRLHKLDGWLPDLTGSGFVAAALPCEPGDVILLRPGPAQIHLAIAGLAGGWVHAHAGLRRVVQQATRPAGPILHHWRLAPAA